MLGVRKSKFSPIILKYIITHYLGFESTDVKAEVPLGNQNIKTQNINILSVVYLPPTIPNPEALQGVYLSWIITHS